MHYIYETFTHDAIRRFIFCRSDQGAAVVDVIAQIKTSKTLVCICDTVNLWTVDLEEGPV